MNRNTYAHTGRDEGIWRDLFFKWELVPIEPDDVGNWGAGPLDTEEEDALVVREGEYYEWVRRPRLGTWAMAAVLAMILLSTLLYVPDMLAEPTEPRPAATIAQTVAAEMRKETARATATPAPTQAPPSFVQPAENVGRVSAKMAIAVLERDHLVTLFPDMNLGTATGIMGETGMVILEAWATGDAPTMSDAISLLQDIKSLGAQEARGSKAAREGEVAETILWNSAVGLKAACVDKGLTRAAAEFIVNAVLGIEALGYPEMAENLDTAARQAFSNEAEATRQEAIAASGETQLQFFVAPKPEGQSNPDAHSNQEGQPQPEEHLQDATSVEVTVNTRTFQEFEREAAQNMPLTAFLDLDEFGIMPSPKWIAYSLRDAYDWRQKNPLGPIQAWNVIAVVKDHRTVAAAGPADLSLKAWWLYLAPSPVVKEEHIVDPNAWGEQVTLSDGETTFWVRTAWIGFGRPPVRPGDVYGTETAVHWTRRQWEQVKGLFVSDKSEGE